jgi:phosphoglycerol transferase MdoB-like AlkP superfamily enzyme
VTTTKTSQFIGGELAFFPDLFIDAMTILPVLTAISCILIFISLFFKRVDKKKWHFFSLICALFILIFSLILFSITMSEFTKAGVGSFSGKSLIDVSVQVEDMGTSVFCEWGPGSGFWLCSLSVIILFSTLVYVVIDNKKRNR